MNELMTKIYLQAEFKHYPRRFNAEDVNANLEPWDLKNLKEAPALKSWTVEDAYAYYHGYVMYGIDSWLDVDNAAIVELLLHYFTNDNKFYDLAAAMEIHNPDLQKGLLLCGNVGTGKTFLLSMFSINQRQPYIIYSAKKIADYYEKEGATAIELFNKRLIRKGDLFGIMKRYDNDGRVIDEEREFFHCSRFGLAVDDMGTEDIKMYMGNKRNVIGDIIENRYTGGCMGKLFHATTNLTFAEIDQYYGERVSSRIRQCMNVIVVAGGDRRKKTANIGTYNGGLPIDQELPDKRERAMLKLYEWGITGEPTSQHWD